jgi:hypothetical protein
MEYICPHCYKDFVEAPYCCDNDCHTLFCFNCDGEVYVYKGELEKGHDQNCGEFSF